MTMTATNSAQEMVKHPLPNGWQLVKVSQVCRLVGDSIDPQAHSHETFAHYSIPAFDAGAKPVIEVGAAILSNKTLIPKGTILFSKLNPRISRVWHVRDDHSYRRICSTEFIPLFPDTSAIDPWYLALVLQEPQLIGRLRAMVAAATKSRERLNPELVAEATIPLPRLPEQRRIAALLTERMAAVERARRVAETQLEAAKALPSAYLRALFTGSEAATWPKVRLSDVCNAVRGVTFPSGEGSATEFPGSIACLTTSGVQATPDWGTCRFIPSSRMSSQHQRLREGDLLVSTANSKALVGKSCLVGAPPFPCTFGAFVTVLRPKPVVMPFLLASWMRTPEVLAYCFEMSSNTTNISNLRVSDLVALKMPLPPQDEQRGIAARLAEQMSLADRVHATSQEQLAVIKQLPAALLRQAFKGEL